MPATQVQFEQVNRLAVGVLHMLLGSADVEFPNSTQAHPSFWVTVQLAPKGPLWAGAERLFPFQVRWDIWEYVVVPVLGNDNNQFFPDNGAERNHLNLARLDHHQGLLAHLKGVLVEALKAAGFFPADLVAEVVPAPVIDLVDRNPEVIQQEAEQAAAGGIERHDEIGPNQFIQFDVED